MDFSKLVKQVLSEEMTSGGEGSVYGPNVGNTAQPFSGDNLAPGDARSVYGGVYGGMLSRKGLVKSKRSKKKRKKRKKSK